VSSSVTARINERLRGFISISTVMEGGQHSKGDWKKKKEGFTLQTVSGGRSGAWASPQSDETKA